MIGLFCLDSFLIPLSNLIFNGSSEYMNIKYLITILSLGILVYLLFSPYLLNMLTFHPEKWTQEKDPDFPNYLKEIQIQSKDGVQLQAFYFSHPGQKSRELILYFHGNAGSAYDRLETCNDLFSLGTDVLLLSYRGYGKSEGKPSEKGINTDGYSLLEYANTELGYTEENILLFGRSLGSTVAVELAQNRAVKKLILVTPLTSAKDMAKTMGIGFLGFIAGDALNSVSKLKNIDTDLLIIHGDKDGITPYWMGQKLFSEYKGAKEMVTIEGGGHNNLEELDAKKYWSSIDSFMKSEMKEIK
jgi:hypothetical protein